LVYAITAHDELGQKKRAVKSKGGNREGHQSMPTIRYIQESTRVHTFAAFNPYT
jgi:hypothetical protein